MPNDADDTIPIEDTPLSVEELIKVRRIIREDEHATWFRKKVKVFLPWAIGVVAGLYAGWQWLVSTIQHMPRG